MHRSGRLFSSKNIPSLIGLVLAASLGVACGGSTDDNLGNASAGGAAGEGGSAGSTAGSAGSGNSTGGSSTAGSSGTSSFPAGGAGGSAAGTGGSGGSGQGGTGTNGCIPGQVVSCPCPGGQPPGAQTCLANGTFDACQCASGTGGTGGGGTGGTGGSGGGGSGGSGGTQSGGTGGTGTSDCNACLAEKCSQEAAACQANAQCAEASQCVLEQCSQAGSQQELLGCATSQCQINIAMVPPGLFQVAQCAGTQCANGECFGAGTGGTGGSGGGSGGTGGSGGSGAGGDPGAAPGKINCGPSLTCDVETDGECCISVSGLSPQYSCTKAQCQGGFISIEQPCDGPEDCEGGKVCCGKFSQQQTGVTCADSCDPSGGNSQSFSLCHKDDDCQNGETCQVCSPGFGFTFRVCGTQCPTFGPGGGGAP